MNPKITHPAPTPRDGCAGDGIGGRPGFGYPQRGQFGAALLTLFPHSGQVTRGMSGG
jgi:hypothetical protein